MSRLYISDGSKAHVKIHWSDWWMCCGARVGGSFTTHDTEALMLQTYGIRADAVVKDKDLIKALAIACSASNINRNVWAFADRTNGHLFKHFEFGDMPKIRRFQFDRTLSNGNKERWRAHVYFSPKTVNPNHGSIVASITITLTKVEP